MGLSDIQSFYEPSRPKIIQLCDVIIIVISSQQNIAFDVKTVSRHKRAIDLPNRPPINPNIPNLNSRIPPPTKKQIIIFGQAGNAKHAIGMMVGCQVTGSSSFVLLPHQICTVMGFIVSLSNISIVFLSVPNAHHYYCSW